MNKVMIRSYVRRDKISMLYLNNSASLSIAIGPDHPFDEDSLTGAKAELYRAIVGVFERAPKFTGDLGAAKRQEGEHRAAVCGPFLLVFSETGMVGGMDCEEAGAWVIHVGLGTVVKVNRWLLAG